DKTVRHSLSLMADMLEGITFRPERMRKALASGFLNATELADYLVTKGMPFREAHHVSGRSVALAEEKGCGLEDLSLDELRALSPLIEEDVFVALDYDTAVARRNVPGGTGPQSVARQLENIKRWLGNED
ncbi:MAG: argininosuccinate lyase, partial [Mailhella sp.]|nr:argininosuccinate lyase [Mailhella sp.]